MNEINLLFTLDKKYFIPFQTVLKSIFINNPKENFHIYMIYNEIADEKIKQLERYCHYHNSRLFAIEADQELFADAPVFYYFSKAIYYRLLAFQLLPDSIDRVLYLDSDTLVINSLRGIYHANIDDYLFAACMLSGFTKNLKAPVTRVRLKSDAPGYYNSGILLMNLKKQRESVKAEEVFEYINSHKKDLILPDQDVLNGLFGNDILALDDCIYNYDAHRYGTYLVLSSGEKDLDWVMNNTVILHFCGKTKPWMKSSRGRFDVLFKHYASLAERTIKEIGLK